MGLVANGIKVLPLNPVYLSYPDKAEGVRLATGLTAWTMPASYTEIIPANTITEKFWIAVLDGWLVNSGGTSTQNFRHTLEIGKGEAGSEASILRHTVANKSGTRLGAMLSPVVPPLEIDANTRIAGRACDEDTTNRDLIIIVGYLTE